MRGASPIFQSVHCVRYLRNLILRGQIRSMTNGTPERFVEEATLSQFKRKRYYPIHVGKKLKDRYRIYAKLGYGAYSTVWLARDERSNQFVSLKVCVQDDAEASPVITEVEMLRRLSKIASNREHPGLEFTRLAQDIFEVDSPSGRHYCIASKPQGGSLRLLQEILPNAMLPKLLVRSLIHRLFFSLNWLHAECGVVHTDVSPPNVLMQVDDNSHFVDIEEQELLSLDSPVVVNNYPVYQSRVPRLEYSGIPVLTDFGKMQLAEPPNNKWWMPDLYRAPEVLLHLPWSYPVDIWSVGVMTLELLEGKNLFDPIDRVHSQYVLPLALAQYISYLGPPPIDMLKQSPHLKTYFDDNGKWISEPPIPEASFEDFVTTIPPGEEKDQFLRFIRKMLTWDPEVRNTTSELIRDEWLMRPAEELI